MVLANHTLLVEGQVIRSPTNTLSVYYRSTPEGNIGIFQLHYQSESMNSNVNIHVSIHYANIHYANILCMLIFASKGMFALSVHTNCIIRKCSHANT